jgi:hypothetical protein
MHRSLDVADLLAHASTRGMLQQSAVHFGYKDPVSWVSGGQTPCVHYMYSWMPIRSIMQSIGISLLVMRAVDVASQSRAMTSDGHLETLHAHQLEVRFCSLPACSPPIQIQVIFRDAPLYSNLLSRREKKPDTEIFSEVHLSQSFVHTVCTHFTLCCPLCSVSCLHACTACIIQL